MCKKLTIKQEKFVLKYFECGNATEAYKYAYSTSRMKDKSVTERASRLLKEIKISTRLAELRVKAEEDSQWTVKELIKAHTRIFEIGIGDVSSSHIVSEGAGDGISNTFEVNMRDTNLAGASKALVEIGKLLGYYKEKIEVEGEFSLKDFVKILHDEDNVGD